MIQDNKLGKLTVDLNANLSPLRRGMAQARSVVSTGVKGIGSALSSLKLPALAFAALLGVGLVRAFSSFVAQSKRLAVLENTFRHLNKNAKFAFKDMELGMLSLAKKTGVSVSDQTSALNQLSMSLAGLMNPQDMQTILLPIALDWAAVSGKTPADAAKDIAEAWMGEPPEELVMPVKLKYEQETGKKFDDLTSSEKWKLIVGYLDQFKGAAEAATGTLGGSFTMLKNSVEDLFNVILGSGKFDPLIGLFQKLAISIYNLAEEIKKGNIPQWLLELQNALVNLWAYLGTIDWAGAFKWIGDNWEKIFDGIKKVAIGLLGLKVAGIAIPFLKGLWDSLGGFGKTVAALVAGGLIVKLGSMLISLGKGLSSAAAPTDALKGAGAGLDAAMAAIAAKQTPFQKILESFSKVFLRLGQVMKTQGFFAAIAELPALIGTAFGGVAAALGISAAALGVILAAIVVAIVGFVLAWKNNWDGVRDKAKETMDAVKKTFSDMYEKSIKPLIDSFAEGWNKISVILKGFGINIGDFSGIFKFAFQVIKDSVGGTFTFIIDTLGFAAKTIGNTIGIIIESVKLLATPFDFMITIIKSFYFLFTGQFDKIGEAWSGFFGRIAESCGKIISYLGNFVGDIINWSADFLDKILAPFTHIITGMGEFRENVRKWGENVVKIFSNWGNALVSWIKNFFGIHSPSKLMADLGEYIGQGLFNGIKGILDTFGKLIDIIVGFFGDIFKGATEWVGNMGKKFGEFATNLGGWIGDQAKKLGGWVSDTASKTADHLKNFGSWAVDTGKKFGEANVALAGFALDQAGKFGGWVSDTADKFKTFLGDLGTNIASIATKFGGWIKDTATNFINMGAEFIKGFANIIAKFAQWILDVAAKGLEFIGKLAEIPGNIAKKFVEIVTSLATGFLDVINKFAQWVIDVGKKGVDFLNKIGLLPDGVADKLKEVLTNIGTGFTNVVNKVKEYVIKVGDAVQDIIDWFVTLPGKVANGLKSLASGITNKMSGAVSAVSGIVNSLLNTITNMGDRFWKAGSGLISSMLNGLKSAWSGLSGWFSDKLSWIRDRLPGSDAKTGPLSTLTKAGRGLITAMQGGAEEKMPGFMRAVNSFAGDVAGALPSSIGFGDTMPTSMAMAGAGSYGSQQAPQVNIILQNGVYTTERGMKDLAASINKELALQYNKK